MKIDDTEQRNRAMTEAVNLTEKQHNFNLPSLFEYHFIEEITAKYIFLFCQRQTDYTWSDWCEGIVTSDSMHKRHKNATIVYVNDYYSDDIDTYIKDGKHAKRECGSNAIFVGGSTHA